MEPAALVTGLGDDVQRLLGEIEQVLAEQTRAAREDDAVLAASLAGRSLKLVGELRGLLSLLPQGAGAAAQSRLARIVEVAGHNQLLLRFGFTSWTAAYMERDRRAAGYNEKGQRAGTTGRPDHRGTLARGVL